MSPEGADVSRAAGQDQDLPGRWGSGTRSGLEKRIKTRDSAARNPPRAHRRNGWCPKLALLAAGRSTITNLREISFFSLLRTPSIPSREMAILSALPGVPRSDAHMRDNNEQDVRLAPRIEPAARFFVLRSLGSTYLPV